MRKCFTATAVLAATLFCFGLDARAGWVMTDKDGSKTYLSDGKVKEASEEGGEASMVMDYKKKQLLVVNPETKVCAQASFDEYCGVMNQMFSAMREAMKSMGGGTAPEENPQVSVKKVGSGGKIAGFDTIKYQVFADGSLYEEVWLSANRALVAEMGDLSALNKFASCLNGGMTRDVEASPEYMKLLSIGLPVKTVSYEMGSPEVGAEIVRMEKKNIPASVFEAPSGYKKVPIGEALGMGAN